MPHLTVDNAVLNQGLAAASDVQQKQETGATDYRDSMGKKGCSNPLLSLAATVTKHAEDHHNDEKKEGDGFVPGYGRAGPMCNPITPSTPSPFGRGLNFRVHPQYGFYHHPWNPNAAPPDGPAGTVSGGEVFGFGAPGTRKLFPSPIRIDSRTKNDKKDSKPAEKEEKAARKSEDKAPEPSSPSSRSVTPVDEQLKGSNKDASRSSKAPHNQEPGQIPEEEQRYALPYYMAPRHAIPPYHGYAPPSFFPYPPTHPGLGETSSPKSRKRPGSGREFKTFSPMHIRGKGNAEESQKENDDKEEKKKMPVPSGGAIGERTVSDSTLGSSKDGEENGIAPSKLEEEKGEAKEKVSPPTVTEDEENKAKKERVISPSTTSLEASQASLKCEDDENTSVDQPPPMSRPAFPRGRGPPPGAMQGYFPPPYYPAYPPHAMHPYPPPYPYGMMNGPPGVPMYHPHFHPDGPGVQGHRYPHLPMPPPGTYPHHFSGPMVKPGPPPEIEEEEPSATKSLPFPGKENATENSKSKPDAVASTTTDKQPKGKIIKSVAEWQQAAIETGKAPSANRCIALRGPIPCRFWGEVGKTKDEAIPDFHRLVNYPDYMAKSRSPNGGSRVVLGGSNQDGKKPCVMCGKMRLSSASACLATASANRAARASSKGKKNKDENADKDDTIHIIPRQNKGLCTACDVAVWVIVDNGLEIKWCKGCKNFRPWAAFGDKGMATKCVRCRDRQREKYAMQKDSGLRQKRKRQENDKSTPTKHKKKQLSKLASKEKKQEEDNEKQMAAAQGLHNLIAATVEMTDNFDPK